MYARWTSVNDGAGAGDNDNVTGGRDKTCQQPPILNEVLALPAPKQVYSILRVDAIRYLRVLFIHYLLLTLLRRDVKCRVHVLRRGVDGRSVL